MSKWCRYCQKTDHDESECWCTRADPAPHAARSWENYPPPFTLKIGSAVAAITPCHPCNCIGPQGGAPRCPCMMRGVVKRDGRWIQAEVDLGPAS